MQKKYIFLAFVVILLVVVASFILLNKSDESLIDNKESFIVVKTEEEKTHPITTEDLDSEGIESAEVAIEKEVPISRSLERVTKKQFGIKVSPNDSPVQPEKFSGYHTGVDFEIFPEEVDVDVEIYAICDGSVIFKNHVNGYGGVVIQECVLQNKNVTVLYGHLKLEGIAPKLNQNIKEGGLLGILGKGFSNETDGERKHLHLAIHKGKSINLRGYVGSSNLLEEWIDPLLFLR